MAVFHNVGEGSGKDGDVDCGGSVPVLDFLAGLRCCVWDPMKCMFMLIVYWLEEYEPRMSLGIGGFFSWRGFVPKKALAEIDWGGWFISASLSKSG